jgi:hypothetical protein
MQAPPPAEPPLELTGGQLLNPLRSVGTLAATDWDRAGSRLAGRPEATALAAARLEWLAGEGRPGGRLGDHSPRALLALEQARTEVRGNLGISPEATPEEAVAALLEARRALRAGDTTQAEAALRPPVFREVQPPPLRRLNEPGVNPDAEIATAALREEIQRAALTPRGPMFDTREQGITTFGFGGGTR